MPGRSEPVLLGDPGSAEQLAQVSGLVRLAVATTGVLGLVVTAIVLLTPAPARPDGYHPIPVALASVAVLTASALGRRRPQLFSPGALARLLPSTVVAVAFAAVLSGPHFTSLVTMFFVWYASAVTFLPRRSAIALMAWVAVVDGTLLALQPGNPQPVIHWEITMGIMVITAVATNRLVERASTLTGAERAARDEAERARCELEVVSADKSRFLARMSHELRTPLNAIIGFSEVLARRSFGELNAKQAEYVDDLVDSGRHLLSLVDDVLDLAKVETGTVELDIAPVALADLLTTSLGLFKEQAGRRGITLTLEVGADLQAIDADPRKVKQVVFNLLANAIRFTPPGGRITLGARGERNRVFLWVSDTGPGIATEDREVIFEEFQQGSERHGDGTGLGLPVARHLVELHGGRLWVDGELGAGSTFTAELPRRWARQLEKDEKRPPIATPRERLVLGEPDSPERRAENARLLFIIGIGAVLMGSICLAILHGHPPARPVHYQQGPLVVALLVATALLLSNLARPQWLGSPLGVFLIGLFGIVYLSVSMTNVGPALGDVPLLYVVTIAGLFMILSPWQLAVQLSAVGVCYAVVLAVEGYDAPLARWMVTTTFVVVTALILRRFVTRLTALVQAERAARTAAERAAAELAAVSRHKTAFLANMSHELRTPLNVIIGFSEVLESEAFGPLNEKQTEYVHDVLSSGRHLLALINGILELAKIDAGRMDLWLTELDVEAVLTDALHPFRAEAVRRHIELAVEAGDAPTSVEADSAKLGRAVGHLISNALKFTPDGGRVTLAATQDSEHVEISVTDTGRGIEAGDHERIFDAFALGDAQTDQGTGLGLTLARRYAELHHGTLDVTSAAGRGATFTLRLPLRPDTASASASVAVSGGGR